MTTKQLIKTKQPKPGQLEDIYISKEPQPAKRRSKKPAPDANRITNATTTRIYDGKELHRNAGIPASRFKAFELPSLMHGRLVYPEIRK